MAGSTVVGVRGRGIRGRLIRLLHVACLRNTLAIVVPLRLSASLRGASPSRRLGLEREAAAFLCKLGCEGWCRFHRCREGANDDQYQCAQSSENRRHGTPHCGGAILRYRRCIAAPPADAIPLGGVHRFRTTLRNLCKVELSYTKFCVAAPFRRRRAWFRAAFRTAPALRKLAAQSRKRAPR